MKTSFILFFFLLASGLMGCKKFVQIGAPNTQLIAASVFKSSAAATAAQTAIYSQMYNESFYLAQSCGLLSDELTNYSTDLGLQQYYTNSMTAAKGPGPWSSAYKYIYQANAIIEGLRNNASIDPAIAQQLTGESKFLRAFWLFCLTNVYGDVPLVTTTDYTVNGPIARSPQATVYQQIVADLKDAQSLLNANYVDASDTAITNERVRPTKGAATSLLARVYLYTQKYDSAEAQASVEINNSGLYTLCGNLTAAMGKNYVFQKNSTEAIWQLQTSEPASWDTQDGEYFILTGAPGSGIANSASISPQLLNSFETGDMRLVQWVGTYKTTTIPATTYYFPYKYHSYNNSSSSSSGVIEYVMILRLAEQYLIRAEARAQLGETSGAVADLNMIRNRAGLAGYIGATDKSSLLAAILHERQVELFTEWGHRWFDLKRTAKIDAVMGGPTGACQAKNGFWHSTAQLFPIPQSEISNDANLKQNSGY